MVKQSMHHNYKHGSIFCHSLLSTPLTAKLVIVSGRVQRTLPFEVVRDNRAVLYIQGAVSVHA